MNKFGKWISNHTKIVLILTVILIVPAILGIISTKINYDILSYLPQDLDSTKGQKVLEDVYSDAATSMLIIEGMKDKDVVKLKDKIKNISVLSNSNSRSAISRFYSNYKSDSTQKLIKGLEDGILSLNSDDLKAIEGLKSNLNDLSVDIEANKNNIESINKMVDGIKENPELLQKLNKFSSDLKNSESTIKDIEKILSKGDGSLNIKEVKALGERLLSMQQDLKDSEDILRITKGSLEKNNVQMARELIKSLPELEDGVNKLAEGSTKLNEEMEELHKGGYRKIK